MRRDRGFTAAQLWVMTLQTLMGASAAFAMLSGLPMLLLMVCAQLIR